jgi:hypothetical protein
MIYFSNPKLLSGRKAKDNAFLLFFLLHLPEVQKRKVSEVRNRVIINIT